MVQVTTSCREVVIVQRRLTEYRVTFFEKLRQRLSKEEIGLRLLIGEGTPGELKKKDEGKISWAERSPTTYLLGDRLCWHPFFRETKKSSLIVLTHENKLIANYLALLKPKRPRIAFWGHGRNFQASNPNSIKERIKRMTVTWPDWWFAYTSLSATTLIDAGFDPNRITIVNNSFDTNELSTLIAELLPSELEEFRNHWALKRGKTGIFIGSLHAQKNIPFLIDSTLKIARNIPDFKLIVGGDGEFREIVEKASLQYPNIVYLGRLDGKAKALALASADLFLNPGLVGLGILDAFVSKLPLITTEWHGHSPEIAYLKNDVNGLITRNDTCAFAAKVTDLIRSTSHREILATAAYNSAKRYSLDEMVENFRHGIVSIISSQSA